ncbi:MAG: imidazolonepropionase-like amidohydrolase [Chlamydiales bacterium]|jgi:imidazolonepropionase-like amidohydrolase
MRNPMRILNDARRSVARATLAACCMLPFLASDTVAGVPASGVGEHGAGEQGGRGLALRAKKILVAEYGGQSVINNGLLLVRDGKIEAVGCAHTMVVPEGYDDVDLGDLWIAPGMVDLHCHVAGSMRDINDTVYLTNPGCRASATVTPGNPAMRRAVAGGVTSVLYIPGSGTNIGGQGVLLRTGFDRYDDMELRNPGSLKLAQAGNPERWVINPGRSFMNWNTRNTFKRGIAYAKRWEDHAENGGQKPEKDIQLEIFKALTEGRTQISTHTQIYQVVLMTLTMVRKELGLPVYIDHGTFDGWRAGAIAQERGVPAILGPRAIDVPVRGFIRWSGSNPERIQGVAAGYQKMGHKMIGFNTDSPVVPQEELSVQAAMGVRYGFDNTEMDAVRGLTIVPAMAAGIDDRVGSIEVGKEADLLIVTGDPADPRTSIEGVYQRGVKVYDTAEDRRRW